MLQTFMPLQGEGGAPVSMSDTFSKLIVCLTAAARPSILCFCRGFKMLKWLDPAGCRCKRFREPNANDLWVWQSVASTSEVCQDSFRNPGAGKPRTCQELLRSFTWSHKGSQCKVIARPCGQPHWSTRCLTLLMDWVMSNNPKVRRTVDACSRHSCRYREKGVPQFRCQTLSANWSYAWPPEPGHRFCVLILLLKWLDPAGCQCKRFRQSSANDLWVWQSVAKYLWGVSRQLS